VQRAAAVACCAVDIAVYCVVQHAAMTG
jgi:hypothetical protein